MGKKYIIEIIGGEEGDMDFSTIEPYTEPDTDSIRKEAYDKGYTDAAYNCHERCAFLDDAKKEAYQRGYETAKHECEECNANAVKIVDDKVHEAYKKGLSDSKNQDAKDFADMYDSGYSEGLKDACEAARKVVALSTMDRRKVFGSEYMYSILENNTASEAIEKIRQYEQEKEEHIQVGDEVETPSGLKGYVVNFTDDELVHYVSSEGRFGTMGMSAVSKTGRHFPEIAEVLQKMKES